MYHFAHLGSSSMFLGGLAKRLSRNEPGWSPIRIACIDTVKWRSKILRDVFANPIIYC